MREPSRSFLLRCWFDPNGSQTDAAAWRFSLTHIAAQRTIKRFADLEAVMAYLHQILAADEHNGAEAYRPERQ